MYSLQVDFLQVVTLIGAAVGSLTGSYFVALRATQRQQQQQPAEPPLPVAPHPAVALRLQALEDAVSARTTGAPHPPCHMLGRIEALEKELRGEVRELEQKLAETLTLEEFQAYTNMDGQRREQLIAKIGELQGSLAALFPRMRK